MTDTLKVCSPVDNSIYVERPYASNADINACLSSSMVAQNQWQQTSIDQRKAVCLRAVEYMLENSQ